MCIRDRSYGSLLINLEIFSKSAASRIDSYLEALFGRAAAGLREEVDDEVDEKFDDLHERQQRHSEVESQTPADIRHERIQLEQTYKSRR